MKTKMISDVQLSPDNESVLFVVTEPKMVEEKEILFSTIYQSADPLMETEFSSTQPRWSPDGARVAFVSIRQGIRNLYLMDCKSQEVIALTNGKMSVQTFSWAPDGKKIAFVMAQETQNPSQIYKQKISVNCLWVIELSSLEMRALTSEMYCVRGLGDFGTMNTEFDWSLDSKKIVFAHSPSLGFDSFHVDSSLAIVDLETGEIKDLEKQARYEANPRYSPDGKWIAYVSSNSPQTYSLNHYVAIRSTDGNEHRLLAHTFNEGSFLAGPNLLGWNSESDELLFFEPKGTKFHLLRLPIDGRQAKEVETGQLFFKEPILSPDRSKLGIVVQTPTTPPEAMVADLEHFAVTQVSNLNAPLLSYPQMDTKIISWASKDGLKIEGLLTYPINYKEGKRYPLLLVIHGGPMGFFDESFLGTPNPYPLAAFAQEGFFILRPNPRGSTGYGKAFRCANYYDWGGADYVDIQYGIDSLIAKGIVDPERLGIMGWSYGGYMTGWTIGQTNRFKAASVGAGVTNLVSFNGTSDLYRFLTDYLGEFTENREFYEERSPINFVARVQTPCLIQHGTTDKRTAVSQAYEYYHALNRLGKEVKLVLYPGMEHRLVDPQMQLDAMNLNLEWFQRYLSDETIPRGI